MEIFFLLGFGFLIGLEHSLEADHIAAISTITARTQSLKKAILAGIYWGIGHTMTLLLTAATLVTLHWHIPEKITYSLEAIVGAMLIFLGLKNLFGFKKNMLHQHGDSIHIHPHKGDHKHEHASLWIGMVHGLAGSSLLMLIVFPKVDSLPIAVNYVLGILIFGLGTMLGMALISCLMGIPSLFFKKHFPIFQRWIVGATGLFSAFVGLPILVNSLMIIFDIPTAGMS